jgi:peroxiredoxin
MMLSAGQIYPHDDAPEAPDLTLVDTDGAERSLSEFWREGLTAFTFIRYLGCIFCRAQVKELRDRQAEIERAGLQIVIVTPERPLPSREFAEQFALPFPLLTDPRREAYRAYGLTEATRGQLVRPHVWVRAAGIAVRGTMQGKPDNRASRQLPGTAIVDMHGRLRFLHHADDPSDHLPLARLIDVARVIGRQDAAIVTIGA